MTFEQKSASVVNILSRDYVNLIGIDGIGMYSFLMRIETTKLGNFDLNILALSLNIQFETAANIIKRLHRCELIDLKSKKNDKYTVKTLDIKPLSSPEKLHFMDRMFDEKILTYEQKVETLKLLKIVQNNLSTTATEEAYEIDDIKKERRKRTKKAVQETDLLDTKNRRKKDTGPALVDAYYKTISKYFNQYFVSKNMRVEANILLRNMRKYGDNPDKVRAMFEYVGSFAKSKEEVERVKQIDYYIKHRDDAYYHTFTNPSRPTVMLGVEEIKPQENVSIKYVKEMYEYYKRNSMASDIIVVKLVEKYGQVKVDEFLKTMV